MPPGATGHIPLRPVGALVQTTKDLRHGTFNSVHYDREDDWLCCKLDLIETHDDDLLPHWEQLSDALVDYQYGVKTYDKTFLAFEWVDLSRTLNILSPALRQTHFKHLHFMCNNLSGTRHEIKILLDAIQYMLQLAIQILNSVRRFDELTLCSPRT